VIAVRADNAAGRALALLSVYPRQLDAPALGLLLRPMPRRSSPFRSWGDRCLWRESCEIHRQDSAADASRILEQLRRRRLVEARGVPRLSPGFQSRVAERGVGLALEFAAAGVSPRVKIRRRHLALVALADGTGSLPPYETIADMGRQMSEAYRELVAIDVLVPPSRRSLTDAGSALVASWSTP
jgi:hypothetical protein